MNLFITGANQGIGYYLAAQALEEGNAVSVLDVETDRLAALAAAHPGRLLCHRVDVRDAEAVRRAVEATAAQFGRIDAAIHNACLCPKVQEARDSASHREVFDVNYFGALHVTQCVLPHMRRQGGGRVFFTCSGVGITGFADLTAYAPSKAALEALAKCCALECADAGVTFHILHPPLTRTRSSAFLPVPPAFMADPEVVGRGLAKRLTSRRFVLCHSLLQRVQTQACYLFPLRMGRLLTRMTARCNPRA